MKSSLCGFFILQKKESKMCGHQISKLWPPAAATSIALLQLCWPFTSLKSITFSTLNCDTLFEK